MVSYISFFLFIHFHVRSTRVDFALHKLTFNFYNTVTFFWFLSLFCIKNIVRYASRGNGCLVPATVTMGCPGLFRGGGSGMSGSRVLREVGCSGVLYLRGVYNVLTVVSELNLGLGAGPFAVTCGVTRAVSEGTGVSERSKGCAVSEGPVSSTGVSGSVGSDVSGLKVGHLGCVNNAAVVRQGSGAVLQKTCDKIKLY